VGDLALEPRALGLGRADQVADQGVRGEMDRMEAAVGTLGEIITRFADFLDVTSAGWKTLSQANGLAGPHTSALLPLILRTRFLGLDLTRGAFFFGRASTDKSDAPARWCHIQTGAPSP
jgi:hypothetical protein